MRILFSKFLQDKKYLHNLAGSTLRSYELALDWFEKLDGDFSKSGLDRFVIGLRKAGMSPGGCNVKIRAVNSFLTWCEENGYCGPLKIKLLKKPQAVTKVLTDKQIQAYISFKPKTKSELRLYTLVLLLIDTGIRINEALTLRWEEVDFDNLLVTVVGKGDKSRVIPFSIELRKVLYKFYRGSEHSLVFATRRGCLLEYHNMRRDLLIFNNRLGIEGFGFHDFRRYFATNFIRQNGNTFILKRLLGHSSVSVTELYIRLVTDDLSRAHGRTSALSRFR